MVYLPVVAADRMAVCWVVDCSLVEDVAQTVACWAECSIADAVVWAHATMTAVVQLTIAAIRAADRLADIAVNRRTAVNLWSRAVLRWPQRPVATRVVAIAAIHAHANRERGLCCDAVAAAAKP